MKTITFIITIFLASIFNTQAQSYDFETTAGTYENLVGSTSINNGMTWDHDGFAATPIGFDFEYFNTTTNQLYLLSDTVISIEPISTTPLSVIFAYGADIIDRGWDTTVDESTTGSLSNISYLLEGNAGSRIFKIEWNNVGYYEDLFDDDVSIDFTNFQVWFYEGSNNIEIHFGPNSITQPLLDFDGSMGSLAIVLVKNLDLDTGESEELISIGGDPSSPTVGEELDGVFNGVIPNGTIYRFTNATAGVASEITIASKVTVFPNPAKNEINIDTDLNFDTIAVYSMLGNKITESNSSTINVSNLSQGVYLIKVKIDNTIVTKTFIKN